MNQSRGILFLAEPLTGGCALQNKSEYTNSMTLIFDENGRYLSRAQEALWRLRQRYGWICVAAEGEGACVALALAAQLPVDRLALMGSGLFLPRKRGVPRELARLRTYARRNLPLVVSEILLFAAAPAETKGFLRGCTCAKICSVDAQAAADCRQLLTAPWEQLC